MGLLILLLQIYQWVLFAYVILSWIPIDRQHPVVRVIEMLTEPVLKPIRKVLPSSSMGIDFSPLVVFGIIYLVLSVLGY